MITRRQLLGGLTAAGAVGGLGIGPQPAAAEPPPETTRVRLFKFPGICIAPQYVADGLLRAEGFADVQYLEERELPDSVRGRGGTDYTALASGELDVAMAFVAPFLIQVDRGADIVMLAGVHPGCFELFGTERVRAIRDLKGKTVAVTSIGGATHVFVSAIAAYVGLDPQRDITWVVHRSADAKELLAQGKVDAWLGFPPDPQDLRARGIGRVVVNSALDRPWSQYFCCIVTANRHFARRYPVATKRAVRAILKATSLCALEPERAARLLVDRGFTPRYDYALQTLKELPYGRWREYDPEDTVRFYALRLHEAGMVKSSPQKLIAQGTDWRFLTELKQELKG